jgi:hypothetical protein
MYSNDQQQQKQQSRCVISVTLVDQSYTLPPAPVVDKSLNTSFKSSVSSSSYNNNDNTGHSNNSHINANKPLPTTITATTSTAPRKKINQLYSVKSVFDFQAEKEDNKVILVTAMQHH